MATITGTNGNDLLLGGADDDLLLAFAGEDTLDGGGGLDRAVIDRSAAAAAITFFALPAQLTTTLGGLTATGIEAFSLTAGSGADGLVGGAGDDSLAGGAGMDALAGGAGADTLDGGADADTLLGGGGGDVLTGGAGADRFVLTDSAATAAAATLAAPLRIADFDAAAGDRLALRGTMVGAAIQPLASRSFALAGTAPLPVVFAGALAPRAAPAAGQPLPDPTDGATLRLFWQPGTTAGGWLLLDLDRDGALGQTDLVVRLDLGAGAGVSAAEFLPATFALAGTTGADSLAGDDADDRVLGLDGADTLAGGLGADTLEGAAGRDVLSGDAGADVIDGGNADDTITGGAGTDVLAGGDGEDRLDGGDAADLLEGGGEADLLVGGAGDDRLDGGGGADLLLGGAGADLFRITVADSSLNAPDQLLDFARAEGDRLRLDGLALPLVWSGPAGAAQATLEAGYRLPSQRLPGSAVIEAFWVPARLAAAPAGGWLVADLDGNGLVGPSDLVVRVGSVDAPVTIGAADFAPDSFLRFAAAVAPTGTAGDDSLAGGLLSEAFQGTAGSDLIDGGAGAGNALSYAGIDGPIALQFAGGRAVIVKEDGGLDLASNVHAFIGTDADDTLDGGNAPAGLYSISLEGRGGIDLLVGDRGPGVQASYANSPAAVSVNLSLATAEDGWGSTDFLVGIRRVALTSGWDDSLFGSGGDDTVLSGTAGNKVIDGWSGLDVWRYLGTGAVTVNLVLGAAYKPGGIDLLTRIEGAYGGDGNDSLQGGNAEERLAGGPGNDTISGGNGYDTVDFGLFTAASGLPTRGVVANLAAGTATDPWGGSDSVRGVEHAWGTGLGDDLTGLAGTAAPAWLRGLAGDDTLRAATAGTLIGADYAADPAGILADLGAGTVTDGFGGLDTLVNITVLRASAWNDSLRGSAAADRIEGGEGDDTLDGAAGNDRLVGGGGDDTYWIDSILDVIEEAGGGGWDTALIRANFYLRSPWVEAIVVAPGAGNVFGVGNALDNELTGNEGNNKLVGQDGNDVIVGLAGDDILQGVGGEDRLHGDDGADTLQGGDLIDTVEGGAGNDLILGDEWHDLLFGDDGNDTIFGGTGSDVIEGNAGHDKIIAQSGHDSMEGGAGVDQLFGANGNDTLDGGTERDTLVGDANNDLIWGGAGYFTDVLYGGDGNDTLDGSARDGETGRNLGEYDRMTGGLGNDTYYVDSPSDVIVESQSGGTDIVFVDTRRIGTYTWNWVETIVLLGTSPYGCGNAIDNVITGSDTRNTLLGRAGDDTLDGRDGDDVLYGNEGADTFLQRRGEGADTIVDFTPGVDHIVLEGFADLDFTGLLAIAVQSGAHLALNLGLPDRLILRDTLRAELQPQDFTFLE